MTDTPASGGLSVRGLARRFGPRWVLQRVSLEVPAGGALMLVGPNGSGKTTLLRCLATALKPHDGAASFEGKDIWTDRYELREHIALLSHATALYDDLSARENMVVWAKMGGMNVDVDALLARVGLPDTGSRPARAFSAGMRRRLALARALLKSPRLVLFDEPFTALDPVGRDMLGSVLRDIRATGATLVLSTHHPEIAGAYCDSAARLENGKIVWRGLPADAPVVMGET